MDLIVTLTQARLSPPLSKTEARCGVKAGILCSLHRPPADPSLPDLLDAVMMGSTKVVLCAAALAFSFALPRPALGGEFFAPSSI